MYEEAIRVFVEELLNGINIEDKNIEFKGIIQIGKSSQGKTLEIGWLKTLAAYANTDGGKLYVGIEDKSHKIVALDHMTVDQIIRLVHRQIRDRVEPIIDYSINTISVGNSLPSRYVIEIEVRPNKNLPVAIHENGLLGIYVRNYGQTDLATSEQIREMVLNSENIPYDSCFVEDVFMASNFSSLINRLEELGLQLNIKELQSIGFLSVDNHLSKGAMLFSDLCSDERTKIVATKWPSIDKKSNIVNASEEFVGNLLDAIVFGIEFVRNHSANGFIKTSTGRNEYVAYPARAVTEGIVNAVGHRNYFIQGSQIEINIFKDRLEITSPGSLLGVKNLHKEKNISSIIPRRRNEVICSILNLCRYMEEKGSGFDKIEADYEGQADVYKPYITSDATSFTLVLPDLTSQGIVSESENYLPEVYVQGITEGKNDLKILSYCYTKARSVSEIAELVQLKPSTYFRNKVLGGLVANKLLYAIPNGRGFVYISNKELVQLK